ncbi:hypothetical protein GTY65_09180 [Streptomyces sp. SID8379]|uniref:protein phosphatase 2C domain-containing protein n=1 Tax=unclassified Streptomyces TaxID=2593676 RepID=UPI00039B4A60|nr:MULTISPECIES: protein phosphatase 2C domain-containing protein [unclassified Streptomyces]MYW64244.1 hypothetical protein [Streptomyces sp. SID8379]
MSQQGDRPTGRRTQEDDWWGQLYEHDEAVAAADTGATPARDTLDDRFASAGAVATPPGERATDPAETAALTPDDPGPASGGPRAVEDDTGVLPPLRPGTVGPPRAGGRGPAGAPDGTGPPATPDRAEPEVSDAVASEPTRWEPLPGREIPAAPPAPEGPTAGRGSDDGPGRSPASAVPVTGPPGRSLASAVPVTGPPDRSPAPELPTRPPADPPPAPPTTPPVPVVPPVPAAAPVQPERSTVPSPQPAARTVPYVGDGPPTYDAEPTALPAADPEDLDDLVADTVLDGARYGACVLRAASVRGDSARYRGEPRRDSLLTARFGSGPGALILVAMATGARATPGAHRAAAEACDWIGRAVGLSHARLAEDIRAGRRGDLKSGLHRLTDRSLGKLRAAAAEQGLDPEEYAATLRCLLVPADPDCRTRVYFGVGGGGLFRLRDGAWQDIEPSVAEQQTGAPVVGYGSQQAAETPEGDRLTMDLGITTPPSPYEPAPQQPPRDPFRFRASVARPGDTLLLCTAGLAEPLRGEPDLARHLAGRWADAEPPGLAAFLADTQVRVKGYADDRTAVAVWEA